MELCEKIKPDKTAVIVLDIQNDFCHKDGAFAKKLEWDPSIIQEMVPRLEKFINEARKCGCKIFFSKMINDREMSPKNLQERLSSTGEKTAKEWPFALKKDSWGRELYEIKPNEDDIILDKKYYDFFTNPDFKEKLKEIGIENLVITGVYTEVCVLATAERGFSEGYNIIISQDLVESITEREKIREQILELLNGYCAEVVESKEIIKEWEREFSLEKQREVKAEIEKWR